MQAPKAALKPRQLGALGAPALPASRVGTGQSRDRAAPGAAPPRSGLGATRAGSGSRDQSAHGGAWLRARAYRCCQLWNSVIRREENSVLEGLAVEYVLSFYKTSNLGNKLKLRKRQLSSPLPLMPSDI